MKIKKEIKAILLDSARLFGLAWREHPRLVAATTAVIVLTALLPFLQNFAIGELLNHLVDSANSGGMNANAQTALALLIVAGTAFALSNTLQFHAKTLLYKRFFRFFTVLIHRRIGALEIKTHETPKRKDLITKVQENAMWRAPDYLQRSAFLVQNVIECTVATAVFLLADWRVGLFIFAASIPRLVTDVIYNHRLWQTETSLSEVRRKFWYNRHYLVDLKALTELKLFQGVPFIADVMEQQLKTIESREVKVEKFNLRLQLLTLICSEGASIFAIVFFVNQVAQGDLAVGTLAFYLTSLFAFRASLGMLSQNIGNQFRDGKFVRDMFEMFDLPYEDVEESRCDDEIGTIETIEFENVTFSYSADRPPVLNGLNLKLTAGETLGLVGENGMGKTTIAKLLSRMYEPTGGRILVNGRDYREFDLSLWRSKIGVMLQEFNQYEHFDVRTAIRLGRISHNGASGEAALQQAAMDSDAMSFINALPWELDTVMSPAFDKGTQCSGGQQQKVAIARTLYRKPEVAIFDEPTSAIDGAAEARIYRNLLTALPGSIRILISHRFYTLKRADKICVIDGGQVKEWGSHDELMRLDGVYAERYLAQAGEYGVHPTSL